MAAPLAKGLIITASVLVAAGIACYENEQIREWILNSRRKLAIALHSLGEEIDPQSRSRNNSQSNDEEAAEARRNRRHEIIRLNRLDMVKQAREAGIAVDLDELMKIGSDMESPTRPSQADRGRSFDEMVGEDGTLKRQEMAQTSGADTMASGMRQRDMGLRGMEAGSSAANPFDDEAQILFDRELIGADSIYSEKQDTRQSTATLSPDLAQNSCETPFFSDEEMAAQMEEAIRRSLEEDTPSAETTEPVPASDAVDLDPPVSVPQSTESSYYYAPPPHVLQVPMSSNSMYSSAIEAMVQANLQHPIAAPHDDGDADDELPGTLTPTDDGFSTAASIIGTDAGDVGRLSDIHSMLDENEMDARSEATSETWSNVGGASTPGSWTDVESEAGDEEGHHVVPVVHAANLNLH